MPSFLIGKSAAFRNRWREASDFYWASSVKLCFNKMFVFAFEVKAVRFPFISFTPFFSNIIPGGGKKGVNYVAIVILSIAYIR